jgi:hypothetical protein
MSVNVLRPVVHTSTLDEVDASSIVLSDPRGPSLLVAHYLQHPSEVHTVKCALRNGVSSA